MKIFLTGSSGFIGSHVRSHFGEVDCSYSRHHKIVNLKGVDVLMHLAGKSHALKNSPTLMEYFEVNTELSIKVFDAFLESDAKVFIILSSVNAVRDRLDDFLTEEFEPRPVTNFGKSKLLGEQYILSKEIPLGKRVYILRPCMIHGPGNKGNLNLLYKIVSKRIPWPLGAFDNKRSFCSIDNLMFILNELIEREDIPSGIYNVADDEPISTNELIGLIAQSQNRKPKVWNISKKIMEGVAFIGDKLQLPLNTERLHKLTSSYVVSNAKLKAAIGKPLVVSSREGLVKTFQSFNNQ